MTEKDYSKEEKKTLKVLKKQADELEQLQARTDREAEQLCQMDDRLADIKARALKVAAGKQVAPPQEKHMPTTAPTAEKRKLRQSDIPSWASLERDSANQKDVSIADLLTPNDIALAKAEAERIDKDYNDKTQLTKGDLRLLAMATSLHSARWLVAGNIMGKLGKPLSALGMIASSTAPALESLKNKATASLENLEDATTDAPTLPEDAEEAETLQKTINDEFLQDAADAETIETVEGEKVYHSWQEILNQESKTVGNDQKLKNPALSWFFGVMNRLTGTVTTKDFSSFDAENGTPVKTTTLFADAFNSIKEDWLRLPAAVFAQYKETTPDLLQKIGLPTIKPEEFSPEMVGELYKHQFNQLKGMDKVTLVGKQAVVPLMVNMSIGLLHGYMYNPAVDGDRKYYEARTRKIILYSNALASSGNVAFIASTKNVAKLDLGGALIAGTRVLQDLGYLARLKEDFLKEEIEKVFSDEFQDIERRFLPQE